MISYISLMKKIMFEGQNSNGTLSLFGETLDFDLRNGFPLVTTRKINYKAAFGELSCFLNGYTDVRSFKAQGVNFWDDDCYKEKWANNPNKRHEYDLGKIYGYQWTEGFGFNQIHKLIQNLKDNPSSRRHVLITYNPADLAEMCLPPCYVSHQFYVEGKFLNMLVHQRSADFCLGVPFDIASFAAFQSLIAREVGLVPKTLKIIFGDVHIYKEHFEGVKIQIRRKPLDLPALVFDAHTNIRKFSAHNVDAYIYNYHDPIKYPFVVQS